MMCLVILGLILCASYVNSFPLVGSLKLKHLPICNGHELTIGHWMHQTDGHFHSDVNLHFYNGGPGEALQFSQMWIPHNCRYHRFTSHTLFALVDLIIAKRTTNKASHVPITPDGRLLLSFIGDSITRGVYCALNRLLDGSETLGPLRDSSFSPSYNFTTMGIGTKRWTWYGRSVPNSLLDISFRFELSFNPLINKNHIETHNMERTISHVITEKQAFAMHTNTGGWDFAWEFYERTGKRSVNKFLNDVKMMGHEECTSDYHKTISVMREAKPVQVAVQNLGRIASVHHTKLVYRNNHYNTRFGTECADYGMERLLNNEIGWMIQDTRNITSTLILNENLREGDGLHFDRTHIHTVEQHQTQRLEAKRVNRPYPGLLEMQILQNYLNLIFYEHLVEFFGELE